MRKEENGKKIEQMQFENEKITHEPKHAKNVPQNKMKIWEKMEYIIKNNLIFMIGVILLIYKGLLLNYLIGLPIKENTIVYTCMVSLLIMCPTINHKDKFAYWYSNIVYAIVTLLIYANFLYYSYSTNFLSFYQIENLKYAKEIGSGLFCIINLKNLFQFWIDNIVMLFVSILAYRNCKKTYYRNRIVKIILIAIILYINVVTIKDVHAFYIETGYNKTLIVEEISIYYYHLEDAKDYFSNLSKMEEINEEKLKESYEQNLEGKPKQTDYTGIAKDCNVIFLQLESLNEYVIGKTVNGKEITPNLNTFFKENIYCSDMYNQGLGTTADSEFEMENSMYPLENGYVFQKYYDNTWLDIYTTLREYGYYTSFMHPNTSTYWNREEVYKNGYHIDEYNDIDSFPTIETAGPFYSDEGFLEESVQKMNAYEGKFCTTLVSVTTHIPFYLNGISNLSEKLTITQEDIKDYPDETFRNYLLSCNFVDYAFGKWIQALEETGLLEKSIIVVYGDHGAGLPTTQEIKKLYQENGREYTSFEDVTKDVHIPFGISIPGVEQTQNISTTVSKIDIKPTILDVLGIPDNFSIGTTIFSEKDYSFIKGLGYITSNNYCIHNRYYDRKTLEEIEKTEELEALLQKMEAEIYLSDTIIKNDLIAP